MDIDSPPRAQARPGEPTLLTDLPIDVLSHILSFIPCEDTFVYDGESYGGAGGRHPFFALAPFIPALASRALAQAVRPPCAVWTDLDLPLRLTIGETAAARQAMVVEALARAAPSVRRLRVTAAGAWAGPEAAVATVEVTTALTAPLMPFLHELDVRVAPKVDYPYAREPGPLQGATRLCSLLQGATRLKSLRLPPDQAFEGPAPMLAAASAAIFDFHALRDEDRSYREVLGLHHALVGGVGPGRAGRVIVPVRLDGLHLPAWLRHLKLDNLVLLTIIRG
jgi:hypothetical protein